MASKLNTVAQILLVLAVMFSAAVRPLPYLWMDVLLYSVLVTTIWSGFDYVWRWGGAPGERVRTETGCSRRVRPGCRRTAQALVVIRKARITSRDTSHEQSPVTAWPGAARQRPV